MFFFEYFNNSINTFKELISMKYISSLLISLSIVLLFDSAFAQNTFSGYPEDLPVEKIIFLEYDQLEITEDLKKSLKKTYEHRNVKAKTANAQLKELVDNGYRFDYMIAKRSDIDNLKEEGYKYVLENDMMKSYNNGESTYAGANSSYVSDMYILDLSNGDKYFIFQIGQSYVYFYKGIMKKFLKQVNKEF